jgi:chromosome segregation ATPase
MSKKLIKGTINAEEVANRLIEGFSEAIFEIQSGVESLIDEKDSYKEKLKEIFKRLESLKHDYMEMKQKYEETLVIMQNDEKRLGRMEGKIEDFEKRLTKLEEFRNNLEKERDREYSLLENTKKHVYQQEVKNEVVKDDIKEQKETNKQQEKKLVDIAIYIGKVSVWIGVAASLGMFLFNQIKIAVK